MEGSCLCSLHVGPLLNKRGYLRRIQFVGWPIWDFAVCSCLRSFCCVVVRVSQFKISTGIQHSCPAYINAREVHGGILVCLNLRLFVCIYVYH